MNQMKSLPKPLRVALLLIPLLVVVGFLGYRVEIALPTAPPKLSSTFTPVTQVSSQEIGSYDLLGYTISKAEADRLSLTEEGKQQLSPENGAIAITQNLINLGRDAFYRETFGNEYFFTDVVGAIDGPINLVSMGKAIAALGGKHTTNLQIPLDEDVTIGGRNFAAGTLLNTGLDVPAGSPFPLGMQTKIKGGKILLLLTLSNWGWVALQLAIFRLIQRQVCECCWIEI
ncbi:hypothetical protein H6F93_24405 [Leptolyngbya sp. FACHB-671]|nr:hypothetical protein [Leptolyngbya sp. FACHB-671]